MKTSYFSGSKAFQQYQEESSKDSNHIIHHSKGNALLGRTFNGYDGSISVRSDYNRRDYEMFRPSEREARTYKEVLQQAQVAYKKVGLVRNVIDTMGDFGSYGIRLQHPDQRLHDFYNVWWTKVAGSERSERFLNLLFRHGTVILKKSLGVLPVAIEKQWKKSIGEDAKIITDKEIVNRNVPVRYSFLNPLTVEAVGGNGSLFVDKPQLVLKVNSSVLSFVNGVDRIPSTTGFYSNKSIDKIPPELMERLKNGETTIPLDPELVDTYFYKKDDWELWGTPMIDSVLDDIIMLLKMKQADVAALDGAISNIRLWRLGIITNDAQTTILPTLAQINKLRSILSNNVGGGVMDLVWGPDLDFKESNSQVWRFLGSDKYDSVLTAIYEGLGIPPSLRASGSTNTGNFVGLNTMIKRLEYGRNQLVDFWEKELRYIHKAMGFSGAPPEIIFDHMILADEAAEKQLLIQLWDRDIIPTETILEIFDRLPPVEFARIKKELENRGKDLPNKASPYHNAEKEHDYKKALLGGGQVAPSEVGIKLEPKKDGEKNKLEMMAKIGKQNKKPQQPSGRPKNVVETKKRKKKPTAKPSTKAGLNLQLWAESTYEKIQDIVHPSLLHGYGKSNARQLTEKQMLEIEYIKFAILSNLNPYQEINQDIVVAELSSLNPIKEEVLSIANDCINDFKSMNNRPPLINELRKIYAGSYAIFYNSNDSL